MGLKLKAGLRVFVFSEEIDLRAGFDRLTNLMQKQMNFRLVYGDLLHFSPLV